MNYADKYYNVRTNGTVAIPNSGNPSNSKICLVRIIVNTKGGTGNTAVLYDSNETIGANAENRIGTIDTNAPVNNPEYNLILQNGIYIVVGGGTTPDFTIIYKEIF